MVTQLKRHKTIAEALQYAADHPVPATDVALDTPCWELIARNLYKIAHHPDARVKGSARRATSAQKIILDRLVGRRLPGTAPADGVPGELEFEDLTQGAIDV